MYLCVQYGRTLTGASPEHAQVAGNVADGWSERLRLQMVSTESREYAEVSACQRIAENNRIITDFQTDRLLEKIL